MQETRRETLGAKTMETQKKQPLIPPHIFWPGLVVAFLTFSVAVQVVLLTRARSDGGAQIEEDYYDRAVGWDEQQARRVASQELGWRVTAAAGQDLRLTFVDRFGDPVEGLTGQVELHRPQLSKPVSVQALEPVLGQPGVYSAQAPGWAPGLWDFHIQVQRDKLRFEQVIRYDHAPKEG